jgi:phosphotransferase system HPr-like phosphotransfer protein
VLASFNHPAAVATSASILGRDTPTLAAPSSVHQRVARAAAQRSKITEPMATSIAIMQKGARATAPSAAGLLALLEEEDAKLQVSGR